MKLQLIVKVIYSNYDEQPEGHLCCKHHMMEEVLGMTLKYEYETTGKTQKLKCLYWQDCGQGGRKS